MSTLETLHLTLTLALVFYVVMLHLAVRFRFKELKSHERILGILMSRHDMGVRHR